MRVVTSDIVCVIDQYFPQARRLLSGADQASWTITADSAGPLGAIVELLDRLDPGLWPSDQATRADLLVIQNHFRTTLGGWKINPGPAMDPIMMRRDKKPVAWLLELLQQCGDSVNPLEVHELEFVADSRFREQLRRELAEVEAALRQSQWRAATVLGGALVGALLLDSLEGERSAAMSASGAPRNRGGGIVDLSEWSLASCLAVAREIDLIDDAAETIINMAWDFRSYIHPAKQIREHRDCTAATGQTVRAALEHVIEQLREWHANKDYLVSLAAFGYCGKPCCSPNRDGQFQRFPGSAARLHRPSQAS